MILFGSLAIKTKKETELIARFHGERVLKLVSALRFYANFCSLQSLLILEQRHEVVIAIRVDRCKLSRRNSEDESQAN